MDGLGKNQEVGVEAAARSAPPGLGSPSLSPLPPCRVPLPRRLPLPPAVFIWDHVFCWAAIPTKDVRAAMLSGFWF